MAVPGLPGKPRRLGLTAASCVVFVAAMVAMSFAAVPLYRIFCAATGYGGATRRATSGPEAALARTVRIRFDTNVANGLGWGFRPLTREVTIQVGEVRKVAFSVENRTARATAGLASFNVTPAEAGAYFNKISCFCFDEQKLGPGARAELPVVFFLDPAIAESRELANLDTITLSYTFFPATDAEAPAKPIAAATPVAGASPL
jgi:cytochrome c oxidase assembly protein subunit 11